MDLLILSCSKSKRGNQDGLTALDRYDGPMFRVLRRFMQFHPSKLEVLVLSAKFGLIQGTSIIPDYDQKMTKLRAQELNSAILEILKAEFEQRNYQRILIAVTENYLPALNGYEVLTPSTAQVILANGTIGRKLSILHQWLYGSPGAYVQPASTEGKHSFHLNKVRFDFQGKNIQDIIRQALIRGEGKPYSYQTWYVLIGGQKVAPKWVVSQLTGLPVSAFHSQSARRILQELGFLIHKEDLTNGTTEYMGRK